MSMFSSFCWSYFWFLGWLGDLPSIPSGIKRRSYNHTSSFIFQDIFQPALHLIKAALLVLYLINSHSTIFCGHELSRLNTEERGISLYFVSFSVLLFLTLKKRQSTLSSLCRMFSTSFTSVMSPLQLKNCNHAVVSPHHLEVSLLFQSFVLCLWTSFWNGVNKTYC